MRYSSRRRRPWPSLCWIFYAGRRPFEFAKRSPPPSVADAGSARAPAIRPGPGLREDVDHGGPPGPLLPLLRVRPRGGDDLLLLREPTYAAIRGGRSPG